MIVKHRSTLLHVLATAVILLLFFQLAGCGVTTSEIGAPSDTPVVNGSSVATHSSITPTVLGTPTVPATGGTANGCPLATEVVQWPSPPTIMITSAHATRGASLQVGQTLEVALAFGQHWSLGRGGGQPMLLLNTPAGYGDAGLKSCIWRFTAEQVGQAALNFTFAPICQAHMECPQFVGLLRIPITVLQS